MNNLRQAAQQALEALEMPCPRWNGTQSEIVNAAINDLRAALADGDKLSPGWPIGWFEGPFGEFRANPLHKIAWPAQAVAWSIPLYTAPPQRKPLTDEEIQAIWAKTFERGSSANTFARAIEQAHGIKSTGCDHCRHPLYAAIKCSSCGRVTE